MKGFQWAALAGQALNLIALGASASSPHTAAIVGGSLSILQAVFPSVFHSMNTAAVAAGTPAGETAIVAGTK